MLVCLILAFLITKAWNDGRIDYMYAKQGLVSPRMEAKYGSKQAARAATERYGLGSFLADAWSDGWRNRTEIRRAATEAAVEAKPSKPGRTTPSWRDRLRAAKGAVAAFGRKLIEPVEARPKPDPTPEPEPVTTSDLDRVRTCPRCGGDMIPDGPDKWTHAGFDTCPGVAACVGCHAPIQARTRTGLCDDCTNDTAPEPKHRAKEKPMTAPTGEAVNYETTVAELEKLIAACRTWLDQVAAALRSCEDAKNHIEDAQGGYRTAAAVAASILEHLAAMNLDPTTLGLIGAIKEALPASDVDVVLALLEEAEEKLKVMKANAQTALNAAEAALTHVQSTYGAAHETVQGQLGGDATFLGDGVTTGVAA